VVAKLQPTLQRQANVIVLFQSSPAGITRKLPDMPR
jgi:hypothetical protein